MRAFLCVALFASLAVNIVALSEWIRESRICNEAQADQWQMRNEWLDMAGQAEQYREKYEDSHRAFEMGQRALKESNERAAMWLAKYNELRKEQPK